jgi:acetyl esterase
MTAISEAPLDPGMLSFTKELLKRTPPESSSWPLDRQRREWDALCAQFRAERPKGLIVEDLAMNGVSVRMYRPPGEAPKTGVIYGHGGGWVLGSVETHDDMCAELAVAADAVVVALNYRLAPEHPHPAQLEDSLNALAFMREAGRAIGIDPQRIIGAGDSAGGQMTAGLCLYLRDHAQEQLKGQVLIYPVLGAGTGTASYRRNADGPCLTQAEMTYYLESFLGSRGGPAWSDPYALPLLAADFAGLPPAFITVAWHDPLHDDGVRFHEKLIAAGVPSALRCEPALAHRYMRARHSSIPAMAGFRAIAAAIRSLGHEGGLPDRVPAVADDAAETDAVPSS